MEEDVVLPEHGIYASTKDRKRWAISGAIGQSAVDYDLMQSPEMHYLDSRGEYVHTETISGKGAVALKKESLDGRLFQLGALKLLSLTFLYLILTQKIFELLELIKMIFQSKKFPFIFIRAG